MGGFRFNGPGSGLRSDDVGRRIEYTTQASNVVLLTQLAGGAFGNHDDWIHAAMRRALEMVREFNLDVRLVSYGTPSRAIVQMAKQFWTSQIDDIR